MAVVAYLLGAGASAQCIPVVNGMKEDLTLIMSEIYGFFVQPDGAGGIFIVSFEIIDDR